MKPPGAWTAIDVGPASRSMRRNHYFRNKIMSAQPSPYVPVLCEFHDRLEAIATARKPVEISLSGDAGVVRQRVTTIMDVYARNGAEYLARGAGEIIRLDPIVVAAGEQLFPAKASQ